MAEGKKFGTFGGVFTPSILTILGVIMYLRMGWVVGHAGLTLAIGIVLFAHLISITTGLSISSIATDKKVGAGGVYYVLSRSLGLPIGGALGITLFVATALSIALYLVGFAEIFNEFWHIGYVENEVGELVKSPKILNSYRLTGSLALLVLTIIAFISTSIAIKSQYIILSIIFLSLGALFLGNGNNPEAVVAAVVTNEKIAWATLFAVFFPAVTGFTAGVAMSGDLKNPKKAIPIGTMGAIAVGLVIYLTLAIFLDYSIDKETLINDPKALFNYALLPILVYCGVWGATLSSALGGILGGPRILQAMSVDKLTPKVFAKGVGKSNEPRNALILTVIIAQAGILIGDLNIIAEVVSMFYLAAYGFINLSFFLESWASADFKPTFKVKKWVGLFGFIATFGVMSQLNLPAMIAAFIIIGGIYLYFSRKQVVLGTGDIWQSVWATIVKKGLKRMETGNDHKRNWKPNTLLFSTNHDQRSKMIEFSKAVSGQGGIITNFDLYENPHAKVLFPKNKEAVKDEELEKHGIFGRKLEVQNIFKGIESIACTFGFSGIEPNTVMMDWPGQTKDPKWFTAMTEKLIELDYNVLYLDYDERWGFRKKSKIDLWWRGVGNNAELMLSLAKFITSSPDWSQANIRVLLANDSNVEFKVVENRIKTIIEQFRVKAEIKVVNNELDKKPIYELMKIHSSEADLVFVGIPEINEEDREDFVTKTNSLVGVIGTTLLVKASSQFEETDLKLETITLKHNPREIERTALIPLDNYPDDGIKAALTRTDQELEEMTEELIAKGIQPIENYHHEIFSTLVTKLDEYLKNINEKDTREEIQEKLNTVLEQIRNEYSDAIENRLPLVYEGLDETVSDYFNAKEKLIAYLEKKIVVNHFYDAQGKLINKKRKIKYRDSLQRMWYAKGIKGDFSALQEFGYHNLILLHQSKNILHDVIWKLFDKADNNGIELDKINACKKTLNQSLNQIGDEALNLSANLYHKLRNNEREAFNKAAKIFLSKQYLQRIQETYSVLPHREYKKIRKGTINFPSYWYRNVILFTFHLQAEIYLIGYAGKIKGLVYELTAYTRSNYSTKINDNLSEVEKQIENLNQLIVSSNEQGILGSAIRISEELYFNSETIINRLIDGIQEMNNKVPDEVELMTAKSINGIRNAQAEEIQTEKIALKEITDYLTRTHFVDPLHQRIQEFYEQLKRLSGQMMHLTIRVQKAIDSYSTTNKIKPLADMISEASVEIIEMKNDFNLVQQGFESELKERQNIIQQELDINQIIEQVETLRQYVKQHKRKNVILERLGRVNKKATKKVGNVFDYLIQKKQDHTAEKYKSSYQNLMSEQGIISNFVQAVRGQSQLPFYYQQLFKGSYFSDSKTLENRKQEIDRVKAAIDHLNNGANGAILILGEAGSGKTYLTTHISSHELNGSLYKIQPPLNRSWTKDDLLKAIQRVTGFKDNLQKIFNKLPKKSTIIFENIEQWWLKAPGGDVVLNELTRIINKYSSKHYFILTANISAYRLMAQHTFIKNAIIESVILPPLTPNQIKDVIWSRHQIGGLEIQLDKENEQHLSVHKINKFLLKFHGAAEGNVGLALQIWLCSILEKEDNVIVMSLPDKHRLGTINDAKWKNMIYQLFIHYNLSRDELYTIYGQGEKNWVNRILLSLKNSGIVKQNERGEFYLIKLSRPYIEKWLKENGFIK